MTDKTPVSMPAELTAIVDERELPGLERTQVPDEELWEVNLEALNGSKYEFDSTLLKPAP